MTRHACQAYFVYKINIPELIVSQTPAFRFFYDWAVEMSGYQGFGVIIIGLVLCQRLFNYNFIDKAYTEST